MKNLCPVDRIAVAVVFALCAAGCAVRPNPMLTRAEMEVADARQTEAIRLHSPVLLRDAEETLAEAQREWKAHRDEVETARLARLTEQKLALAREHAGLVLDEAGARIDRQKADLEAHTIQNSVIDQRASLSPAPIAGTSLRTESVEDLRRLARNLNAIRTTENANTFDIVLSGDSLFIPSGSEFRSSAAVELAPLVDYLHARPNQNLVIETYTTETASTIDNERISRIEADMLRRILVDRGIADYRVTTHPLGEAIEAARYGVGNTLPRSRVRLVFPLV